jgi:hypothetical protein
VLTLVVARMATDDVVGMTKLNLRENPGVQIDSDREALALLREASAPARCTILADKAKKVGRPRNGVFMTMYAFNQVTLARQALV